MPSLHDDDILSRFAYDRDHIRADGTVRAQLLKPKKGKGLSVFEVTNLAHFAICDHGHRYADNPTIGRIHFGYVALTCKDVYAEGLQPHYDNIPLRHVSIPFNTDDLERRTALAQALARKAGPLQDCSSLTK